MAYEFKLPDIGEGVVEGEVVEWLVGEGDTVAEDQPLVAVMTDKATVEIPSPKAGRIAKLGAKPGEIVKVGAMLVSIETGGSADGGKAEGGKAEAAPSKPAEPAAKAAGADAKGAAPGAKAGAAEAKGSKGERQPTGEEAKPSRQQEGKEPAAASPARASASATTERERPAASRESAPAEREDADEQVRSAASPATRKLARELGVVLEDVEGTGPRGRVTREDVEQAAAKPARPRAVAARTSEDERAPQELLAIPHRATAPGERVEERVPLRGLRKRIAERMIESKRSAAHFAYVDECDVTELVALRKRLKPAAERHGVNLTYLPFIMKALVPCLREMPLLNSTLDEASGEIVLKRYYNIGVATDTDRGLTVPVVKDVDRKSILEIAAELTELTDRARANRSRLEDLQEGTFTVTSTGNIGGLFATPIINFPEVAILGVPKIKPRPWVADGQLVIREVLLLALSLDHRVVDGAVGARFMNMLIEYLTDPAKLFLELA